MAISYNQDYFEYIHDGYYYYGYISNASFKNYKLSGVFSIEFKHRFYLSLYPDVCYFTYQRFSGTPDRQHQGPNVPGSYENTTPRIYALALSIRFGKNFKIAPHNFLGVHVGIQSPYLFLNWEPVHYKGVNICGMVLGVNYTVGWGGKKDDAKK